MTTIGGFELRFLKIMKMWEIKLNLPAIGGGGGGGGGGMGSSEAPSIPGPMLWYATVSGL